LGRFTKISLENHKLQFNCFAKLFLGCQAHLINNLGVDIGMKALFGGLYYFLEN